MYKVIASSSVRNQYDFKNVLKKLHQLNMDSSEFKGINIPDILVKEEVGEIHKESLLNLLTIALILDDSTQINIIKAYLECSTVEGSELYSFNEAREIIDKLNNRGFGVDVLKEKEILTSIYKSVKTELEKVAIMQYCNDPVVNEIWYPLF